MGLEGGCYCGALRYQAEGDPAMKAQCFCRECQYFSGGAQLYAMAMPEAGFSYTKGKARSFSRSDLDSPVTREFCGECGTHVVSRAPGLPGMVLLKVGTLDDRAAYEGPQMSIYTVDKLPYHHVDDGIPSFERVPG